ncbi:uncharacterized protein LOC122274353 [Carya illinoinensis]|uniref:uncharacterized protein LOC122274353 n=1 Tax=Carya illinoinensis TaxID=32201 RepID=UPI001C72523F|nr:uncharacterized protein LOC122274353 [Carya illinoinensis]
MNVEDKLIWGPSEKGLYSVKSGYQVEIDKKKAITRETSERSRHDGRWKSIWELNVPGKVKTFMWKAGNDLLATKWNLFKRKILDDPLCPTCQTDTETVMHLLWQCPTANVVWTEMTTPIQKWNVAEDDFLSMWGRMKGKLTEPDLEMIAATMRMLWMRRNELVFDKKFKSPRTVIRASKESLQEYQTANQMLKRGNNFAMVVRDEKGDVLAAACGQRKYLHHPATAESLALRREAEICTELNYTKVILEGDAKGIIEAVNREAEDLSIYENIIQEIKRYFRNRKEWEVRFVKREMNTVAHILARTTLQFDTKRIWIEETPEIVLSDLLKDKLCNG